ncbi:MAG: hypothetical protein ACLUFU_07230 [Bacilli bacterium]
MKKISLLLLCGVILLGVCGCNSYLNDSSLSQYAKQQVLYNGSYKINCPELTENSIISNFNGEFFITNNNVYQLNYEQVYSNEKNCKLIGNIKEGTKPIIFDNHTIVDNKKNEYYISWEKNEKGDYYIEAKTNIYQHFERFDINLELVSAQKYSNGNFGETYDIITYTQNGLFAYYIDRTYNEEEKYYSYKINVDNINNERIIKLYGSTIKTDKAFYEINKRKTNKEQCEKYADVKCEYEYYLKQNKILTKYYNEIMNITDGKIITYDYEAFDKSLFKDK